MDRTEMTDREDELDLPLWKRALRRVIDRLVEKHFPTNAFWGRDYMRPFQDESRDEDDPGRFFGATAARAAIGAAARQDLKNISMTIKGLTIEGCEKGDWRLRIEKISDENEGQSK